MIELINGDCIEEMDKLIKRGIKVDAIITSPPYNKAGYEGFIRKPHKSDNWKRRNIDYADDPKNDFMKEEDYQKWQIDFLNKCYEILNDDGSVFYNHKIRVAQHKASHPIEWILKTNLIFRQQITWDRNASPAVAPIRYIPTTELIFWLTKKRLQPDFYRNKNLKHKTEVWRINPEKNPHPAPFPQELIENIIINLNTKAIILDPFMGSCTTGIVAKKLNRSFIGIEKQKKYFELASSNLNVEKKEKIIQKTLF